MAESVSRNLALGRLGRIGSIFWGFHDDPEEVVVRVLADYAVVGKTPIDKLKVRAKQRVEENRAAKG